MANRKVQQARRIFEDRFARPAQTIIRAPGRVNLIGEHTDYNEGFVLPIAIDRAVWLAAAPRTEPGVRVYSQNLDQTESFSLDNIERGEGAWIEYIKGMAWALKSEGLAITGFDAVLLSDLPIGAGLSSSAALELAAAMAFQSAAGWTLPPQEMARLGQWAENEWVGVQCGAMDQLIVACAREDHAAMIDCRTLEIDPVAIPREVSIFVLDTGARRALANSAYNERRRQCEAAAKFFGVASLRDLEMDDLEARGASLDPLIRRRARHVIGENDRVLRAVRALRSGDTAELGRLFDKSHASLRDDYEVSSPELDAIVECARRAPGCLGARMTGAGFGGCAIALVESEEAEKFLNKIGPDYARATGNKPEVFLVRPTVGATVVED